jgi:hypothetical protein
MGAVIEDGVSGGFGGGKGPLFLLGVAVHFHFLFFLRFGGGVLFVLCCLRYRLLQCGVCCGLVEGIGLGLFLAMVLNGGKISPGFQENYTGFLTKSHWVFGKNSVQFLHKIRSYPCKGAPGSMFLITFMPLDPTVCLLQRPDMGKEGMCVYCINNKPRTPRTNTNLWLEREDRNNKFVKFVGFVVKLLK